MRRLAFIVAIFGMLVLSFLFNLSPTKIFGLDDLKDLELNEKVVLSGNVISERVILSGRILELDNNVTLVCDCDGFYNGLFIEVLGIVEEYNSVKQVRVLEMMADDG